MKAKRGQEEFEKADETAISRQCTRTAGGRRWNVPLRESRWASSAGKLTDCAAGAAERRSPFEVAQRISLASSRDIDSTRGHRRLVILSVLASRSDDSPGTMGEV